MTHSHFTPQQIDKFWSRVDRSGGPDACWPWLRYRSPGGYGEVKLGNRKWRANRAAYCVEYGVDPGELFACHKCDNPWCCNPSHIFLGTARENSHDSMSKGRRPKGSGHGMAALTDDDVIRIRSLRSGGAKLREISEEYGISFTHVKRIIYRKSWKHI